MTTPPRKQSEKEPAKPFSFFGQQKPPKWDERLKEVVANLCSAAVVLVVVVGITVGAVLMLIKLSMWTFG